MNVQATTPATINFDTIKARQQVAWASGDYAIVGTTLQIVGETLCEAVDLRINQRVLDVAAGNGNATLAAARRFADVVSTDYVGSHLDRGRERAEAERLAITFQEADAEALPFADNSFDVVLSTFGVMFTPRQERAASELVRVCHRGEKIGLANWTPESFIGELFTIIGKYVPPAPGVKSPALWGSEAHLEALFGSKAEIVAQRKMFVFRYKSPAHWLESFAAITVRFSRHLRQSIRRHVKPSRPISMLPSIDSTPPKTARLSFPANISKPASPRAADFFSAYTKTSWKSNGMPRAK